MAESALVVPVHTEEKLEDSTAESAPDKTKATPGWHLQLLRQELLSVTCLDSSKLKPTEICPNIHKALTIDRETHLHFGNGERVVVDIKYESSIKHFV